MLKSASLFSELTGGMIELLRLELIEDYFTTYKGCFITDGNLKSDYFIYELNDSSSASLTSVGGSIRIYYRELFF
jgi:hypothetical protein